MSLDVDDATLPTVHSGIQCRLSQSNSIQVIHHVFNNVLKIIEVDRASVPKWMEYMHYHNIIELCDDIATLSYQTYYNLLINVCVRYDNTKKANIGKWRNVYNSTVEPAHVDYVSDLAQETPYGGIDLPSDEFYQIHALPLASTSF